MLIVVADDFSGAAEMAGIGHRYGLVTEIQLKFDPHSKAELIVVDSNTRSLTESDAINRIQQLSREINKTNAPVKLFKKVDSVMRGHIAAEINELQRVLGYERVLLLPANPGRNRIIRSGKYFINDSSLDKTVFASDPDFPVTSAEIGILLKSRQHYLPHVHIKQKSDLPSNSFITADTETAADIKNYISQTTDKDLCCGAAECFEAFLEQHGHSVKKKETVKPAKQSKTLIVNGSTVKDPGEKDIFNQLHIPQHSLPGEWVGEQFILNETAEREWQESVAETIEKQGIAAVSIDHPVKQLKNQAAVFSTHFVKLMHYISERITNGPIHFCLTGGATASAMIESMGQSKLSVKEEVAPGTVTLAREDKLFTVKPGSYAWPESFLKELSNP